MSKKECKHEEWNPCGNDFYSCRKCGILRTSQQVNLYAEKDKQISDLESKLAESEERLKLADCMIHQYADKDKNYAQQLVESKRKLEEYKKCNCKECMTDYEKNLNQIIDKYLNENIKLKQQLAEKERRYETLYKLFSEQHEIIDQNELECFEEVNRLLKEQKDFYVVEKVEYDKMKQGAKDIVDQLKQQLQDLPNKIVEEIKEEGDFSDFGCMGKLRNGYYSISADDLDTILKKFGGENE